MDANPAGAKAERLTALRESGFPVPAFTVVPADALDRFLHSSSALIEAFGHYRQGFVNKLDILGRARRVSDAILTEPFPDSLAQEIFDGLTAAGIAPPWIARSSGSLEDADGIDLAGAYESVPDLWTTDALLLGVRRCWASLFSPQALLRLSESDASVDGVVRDISASARMSVIVQAQVRGPWSGVVFTADPTTGNEAVILIEGADVLGGVAHGGADVARAVALRGRDDIELESCDPTLPEDVAVSVARWARKVHEWAGSPQDIEWVTYPDGSVALVQTRPVRAQDVPRFDDAEPVFMPAAVGREPDGFPLGHCIGIAQSYRAKKLELRQAAREADIPVPAWYWLHYNRSGLDRALREHAMPAFESPFVQIDVSTNIRALVRPVDRLPEILRDLVEAHPAGRLTVHLRDAIPTEIGAVSAAAPDGGVTIEYVMGALQGLRSGVSEASRLQLDPADHVVYEERALQTAIERLVPEENRISRGAYGHTAARLPENQRTAIAHWSRVLERGRSGIRPEWWIRGEGVWLADASFESRTLSGVPTILAGGSARGTVVRVSPDDLPQDLSNGYAISADAVNDAAYKLPELVRFHDRRPWLPDASWIIVADRPRIELALLLPWAAGFVFEEGSLLNHLAITLRARGVAAIVAPGCGALEDGQEVHLSEGQLVLG